MWIRRIAIALIVSSLALLSAPHALALETGAKLPEIGIKDIAGNTVDRASLAGKVVVVDFWATWCGPCKQELPMLDKLYKRYRDKGLVVIAVSVDKELANVTEFLKKMPLSFPIVHDKRHEVSKRYEPSTMPSSFIVDRKGIVRHVHAGYRTEDAAKFENEIKALLK